MPEAPMVESALPTAGLEVAAPPLNCHSENAGQKGRRAQGRISAAKNGRRTKIADGVVHPISRVLDGLRGGGGIQIGCSSRMPPA